MKLDEALSHAEDNLRAFMRQDKARVVEEIRVMHNQQSAVGFLSGTTLRMTTRIAVAAIDRRVAEVVSTLKKSIAVLSPSLVDTKPLQQTLDQFLPESLDDLATHLHYIVNLIGVPNTLAPTINPVIERRKDSLQTAQVDLQLFVSSIYRAPQRFLTSLNIFAVGSGMASVVLCIQWVREPTGPYEPWLALTSTVTACVVGVAAWWKSVKSR